jgi:hypothetical protein
MKKTLVALLIAAASVSAHAETWLIVSGASYHADRSGNWNEQNIGVGIRHNNWTAGTYKNSYRRQTTFVGYVWQPIEFGPVSAGVTAAVTTGYSSPVVAFPTVSVKLTDRIVIDLVCAPAIGKDTTAFVGASLRLGF